MPFAIIASVCIVIYLRKKSPENTNATVHAPPFWDATIFSKKMCLFESLSCYLSQDTEQNYTSSNLLPLYALGAGVLGGMLGLGGGMVINPFFLELGLHPQVCYSVVLQSSKYFKLESECVKMSKALTSPGCSYTYRLQLPHAHT